MSSRAPSTPLKSNGELLFVGKLDWPPNRSGLEWFLKQVFPEVVRRRPHLRLSIIGSGEDKWLRRLLPIEGVSLLGMVEDVAPYVQSCTATIVPLFYGSGTRVKVIESALLRTACVSTRLGVEGTGLEPGKSFFACESKGEWVDTLVDLNLDKATAVGAEAFALAERQFDPTRAARLLLEGAASHSVARESFRCP